MTKVVCSKCEKDITLKAEYFEKGKVYCAECNSKLPPGEEVVSPKTHYMVQ